MDVISEKQNTGLKGEITIPADKSVSHRAVMFSSLTGGIVNIANFSKGADCLSTLEIIKQLGCETAFKDEKNLVINAKNAFRQPSSPLDCGNSGTTIRLMSGILVGQSFETKLVGDESLSKRPMKRVIEPLELMGARILHNDYKAPLKIFPSPLKGIEYNSKLASAQVKSCVLLAGLFAEGQTKFTEPRVSRNHTELMLEYLGANIKTQGTTTTVSKGALQPKDINIAGDISSAAFFMAAASIVPNSDIIIKNTGLNPTRTGIIDVLEKMGGDIEILNKEQACSEEFGDIRVRYSKLQGCEISGEIIPRLIDELPTIAAAACFAKGTTVVKDAGDLRNKESDRIKCLVTELKKIGADIEETEDGFVIQGKDTLQGGCEVECYHDHRLAMSLYVAGMRCENPVKIKEFQWVNISFPEFLGLMENLKRRRNK